MSRTWPIAAAALCGCAPTTSPDVVADDDVHAEAAYDTPGPLPAGPPNVLIAVIDDAGSDRFAFLDPPDTPPPLPTIEALAAEGVSFSHAWAQPSCSPGRATLFTGQAPWRHGIGRWIDGRRSDLALDEDALLLPELLATADPPYASALVGKWHLTGFDAPDPAGHPLRSGFGTHRGSLANPRHWLGDFPDTPRSYTYWQKAVDGALDVETTYMTTDLVQEATDVLATLPEPWLVVLSFNAPHAPWRVPPAPLAGSDTPESFGYAAAFDAMLMAADEALGQVIATLGDDVRERTSIWVTSDNGTPHEVLGPPFAPGRGKDTAWETGLRVPLVVSGAGVAAPGRTVDIAVSLADVLPTALDLAGVDPPPDLDGISLARFLADDDAPRPDRLVMAETFGDLGPGGPGHAWAIRDDRYKLLSPDPEHVHFYDLRSGDLEETVDLFGEPEIGAEAEAAFGRLARAWATIEASR